MATVPPTGDVSEDLLEDLRGLWVRFINEHCPEEIPYTAVVWPILRPRLRSWLASEPTTWPLGERVEAGVASGLGALTFGEKLQLVLGDAGLVLAAFTCEFVGKTERPGSGEIRDAVAKYGAKMSLASTVERGLNAFLGRMVAEADVLTVIDRYVKRVEVIRHDRPGTVVRAPADPDVVRIDRSGFDLWLDFCSGELEWDGEKLERTQHLDFLVALLRCRAVGEVCTFAEIQTALWSDDKRDKKYISRSREVLVTDARKRFGRHLERGCKIESVRGIGYCLVGDLRFCIKRFGIARAAPATATEDDQRGP